MKQRKIPLRTCIVTKEKLEKMLDKLPKETWNDKVFYDDCEKAVKDNIIITF